ncbi:MAG TPA: cytochrome c3 family protein [Anaeromyxobacter sp.]|nr:cytochrome c3 family protein [Anaeromyxobacter sp.]
MRVPFRAAPFLAVLASSALVGGRAWAADVFSPGPLSKAHQSLEGGLESCTKCHVAGQQLAPERCLECHTELKARVEEKQGFHGRLPASERQCQSCHHEHQGRDEPLVDWGPGGQRGFDHSRTGYELKGKHRTVDCARCHDPRRISDATVLAVLEKQPGRKTFIGQPQACTACHFDEHRGQLGGDCLRCHSEEGWKPARGFDHARTAYPLTGRHAQVACGKCHETEEQVAAPPPTVTPPVNAVRFLKYKGMPFGQCTSCHKDPHQDRFGQSCTQCHNTDDWKRVAGPMQSRTFHDQTRYPLRGAHAQVACVACHGPFPGEPARYRGLSFAHCTDCHLDAHLGQMARTGADGASCDRCHTVEAFTPARFELEDHDRTGFKLVGAHRTVACSVCHVKDASLSARVPSLARADLEKRKRPLRLSLMRFAPGNPADCAACHRDPHAGQFGQRVRTEGCVACHNQDTFRRVKLDHDKDTSFPLTGKHAQVACGSCHRPDAAGVVRYAPLSFSCASCHADPHAGQFAGARGQGTDCARCHGVDGFKQTKFVHAPPFTSFQLSGRHQGLACQKCHLPVLVAGTLVTRYRPLPTKCQGCHEDFHRGAFQGFVP